LKLIEYINNPLSGYGTFNKALANEYGLHVAVCFDALISLYKMWKNQGKLDCKGRFYCTSSSLQKETGLTEYQQRKPLQILKGMGLIKQENIGMPAKRYFTLLFDAEIPDRFFRQVSQNSLEETEKQGQKNLPNNGKETHKQAKKNLRTSNPLETSFDGKHSEPIHQEYISPPCENASLDACSDLHLVTERFEEYYSKHHNTYKRAITDADREKWLSEIKDVSCSISEYEYAFYDFNEIIDYIEEHPCWISKIKTPKSVHQYLDTLCHEKYRTEF